MSRMFSDFLDPVDGSSSSLLVVPDESPLMCSSRVVLPGLRCERRSSGTFCGVGSRMRLVRDRSLARACESVVSGFALGDMSLVERLIAGGVLVCAPDEGFSSDVLSRWSALGVPPVHAVRVLRTLPSFSIDFVGSDSSSWLNLFSRAFSSYGFVLESSIRSAFAVRVFPDWSDVHSNILSECGRDLPFVCLGFLWQGMTVAARGLCDSSVAGACLSCVLSALERGPFHEALSPIHVHGPSSLSFSRGFDSDDVREVAACVARSLADPSSDAFFWWWPAGVSRGATLERISQSPSCHCRGSSIESPGAGSSALVLDCVLDRAGPWAGRLTSVVEASVDGLSDHEFAFVYSTTQSARSRTARIMGTVTGSRSLASGKGTARGAASDGAVAESIERGALMWDPSCQDFHASIDDLNRLGRRFFSPSLLSDFSSTQFADRVSFNARGYHFARIPVPFDVSCSDRELRWCVGTDVFDVSEPEVLLPVSWSYMGSPVETGVSAPSFFHDRYYCFSDSNGVAVGADPSRALARAIAELVERDALSLWWYARVRRPVVDLSVIPDPFLRRCHARFAAIGRVLHVIDLTIDPRLPVAAAVSWWANPVLGRYFDVVVSGGCAPSMALAARRAVTEQVQIGVRTEADFSSCYAPFDTPDALSFALLDPAHEFWLVPDDSLPPVADLSSPVLSSSSEYLAGLSLDVLRTFGAECVVFDYRCGDPLLPVRRVASPSLCHFWHRLGSSRLSRAPFDLGWSSQPVPESSMNPVSSSSMNTRFVEHLTVFAHGDPFAPGDFFFHPSSSLSFLGLSSLDPRPAVVFAPLEGVLTPLLSLSFLVSSSLVPSSVCADIVALVRLLSSRDALDPSILSHSLSHFRVRPLLAGPNPIPDCVDDQMFGLPWDSSSLWSFHPARSARDRAVAFSSSLDGCRLAPGISVEHSGEPFSVIRYGSRIMRISGVHVSVLLNALRTSSSDLILDLPSRAVLARLSARGVVVADVPSDSFDLSAWSGAGVTPSFASDLLRSIHLGVAGPGSFSLRALLVRCLTPFSLSIDFFSSASTHCVFFCDVASFLPLAERVLALGSPWIMIVAGPMGYLLSSGSGRRVPDGPCPACVFFSLLAGPLQPFIAFGSSVPPSDFRIDRALGESLVRILSCSLPEHAVVHVPIDRSHPVSTDLVVRSPDCQVCGSPSRRSTTVGCFRSRNLIASDRSEIRVFPPGVLDHDYVRAIASVGPLTSDCSSLVPRSFAVDRDEAILPRAVASRGSLSYEGAGACYRDAVWRALSFAASARVLSRIHPECSLDAFDLLSSISCLVSSHDLPSAEDPLPSTLLVLCSAPLFSDALGQALLCVYARDVAARWRRSPSLFKVLPLDPCIDHWCFSVFDLCIRCARPLRASVLFVSLDCPPVVVVGDSPTSFSYAASVDVRSALRAALSSHLLRLDSLSFLSLPSAPSLPPESSVSSFEASASALPLSILIDAFRFLGARSVRAVDLSVSSSVFSTVGILCDGLLEGFALRSLGWFGTIT